jgi:hypothetical protein
MRRDEDPNEPDQREGDERETPPAPDGPEDDQEAMEPDLGSSA